MMYLVLKMKQKQEESYLVVLSIENAINNGQPSSSLVSR